MSAPEEFSGFTDRELDAYIRQLQAELRALVGAGVPVVAHAAAPSASGRPRALPPGELRKDGAQLDQRSNVGAGADAGPGRGDPEGGAYAVDGVSVPEHSVPIHADVRTLDWDVLVTSHGGPFDAIVLDPPWQLATANPSRGVALGYGQLTDAELEQMPVGRLQSPGGLVFLWHINSKFRIAHRLLDRWGYDVVDEVVWVKTTRHRRLAKSHGYFLQHATERCLVGRRRGDGGKGGAAGPHAPSQAEPGQATEGGEPGGPSVAGHALPSSVIIAERRGQSQKPEELYEYVESLFPGGRFLEIFARSNNLRSHWVSVGNEVPRVGGVAKATLGAP